MTVSLASKPSRQQLEKAFGSPSLSARFDPNLLPLFRQGEFTSTFYTAASENPWQ
jgi:hypothetical protein